MCHEKNLNFENFENCLEVTQLENKVNYLKKNKIDLNRMSLCYHKYFTKNYISILKYRKVLNVKDTMLPLTKLTRLL